jgi:hypothetical protein
VGGPENVIRNGGSGQTPWPFGGGNAMAPPGRGPSPVPASPWIPPLRMPPLPPPPLPAPLLLPAPLPLPLLPLPLLVALPILPALPPLVPAPPFPPEGDATPDPDPDPELDVRVPPEPPPCPQAAGATMQTAMAGIKTWDRNATGCLRDPIGTGR